MPDGHYDSRSTDRNLQRLRDTKDQTHALYQSARLKSQTMQEPHSRDLALSDETLLRAKYREEFCFQLYLAAVCDLNRYMQEGKLPKIMMKTPAVR